MYDHETSRAMMLLILRPRACVSNCASENPLGDGRPLDILVEMLNIMSDPTWDLPTMFGLHNVPAAHSFPFVKQDRATCRAYFMLPER